MTLKKSAILTLIAIFIFGFSFGFVTNKLFSDKNPPREKKSHYDENSLVDQFTRELELSQIQQDTLRVLLKQVREKYNIIRKSKFTQYDQVKKMFNEKFSTFLTEEQQIKFVEFNKKYDNRRKKN